MIYGYIFSRRVLVYEVDDSGTKRVDTNHWDQGTLPQLP